MATKYLAPSPKFRCTDQNGVPLAGGFLTAYVAGTTTIAETYSNGSGTANSSVITLDARGECNLWLTAGIYYDLRATNSVGVLQYTQNRVSGVVAPSSYMASLMTEASLSGVFDDTIALGGTFTGALNLVNAALEYAADVTIESEPTTDIGAAASNNITITPAESIGWVAASATSGSPWRSVAWSPSLAIYAAVAAQTEGSGTTDRCMTSTNGAAWTQRTTTARQWTSICWSDTLALFCAVAQTGTATNRCMTSADGVTWTARTSANSSTNWGAVIWANAQFIATSVNAALSMTSPDGITWALNSISNSKLIYAMAYSPSLNLVVGVSADGTVSTTPGTGGTTWTTRTVPAANRWQGVCWSADLGIFVAVADSGGTAADRIITSPDGINWTARTAPNTNEWFAVVWAPEAAQFIAVAISGGPSLAISMTSQDGYTWEAVDMPEASFWASVTWSGSLGRAVTVGPSGTNQVAYGDF